jgi:hypothetical protein
MSKNDFAIHDFEKISAAGEMTNLRYSERAFRIPAESEAIDNFPKENNAHREWFKEAKRQSWIAKSLGNKL